MMAPFSVRMALLMFASFFLIHLVLASLARWLMPAALRSAEKMRPAAAANLLFLLGVAPGGLTVLAVLGLCLPAYLTLEPDVEREAVGWICGLAAGLGWVLLAESAVRAGRACYATARRMREFRRAGREVRVRQERAWLVECELPVFGVIGMFGPRLVLSRAVLEALSADQLEVAVRHERAHREVGDNCKRFLLRAAPGLFPLEQGRQRLERNWSAFAERAADACAVDGGSARSLALAEGLVRLARLGSELSAGAALFTPFVQDPAQLRLRIESLLHPPAAPADAPAWWRASGAALGALGAALAVMLPASLRIVHVLLEELLALNLFYDRW